MVLSQYVWMTKSNLCFLQYIPVMLSIFHDPTLPINRVNTDIAVRNRNYHTAHCYGKLMPYGITQCYLTPGSGDFATFTPAKLTPSLSCARCWLYPMIVQQPKMVTLYLPDVQFLSYCCNAVSSVRTCCHRCYFSRAHNLWLNVVLATCISVSM